MLEIRISSFFFNLGKKTKVTLIIFPKALRLNAYVTQRHHKYESRPYNTKEIADTLSGENIRKYHQPAHASI